MDVRGSFVSPLHALDGRLGEGASSPLAVRQTVGQTAQGASSPSAPAQQAPTTTGGVDHAGALPVFDELDWDRMRITAVTIGLLADRLVDDLDSILARQKRREQLTEIRTLADHFDRRSAADALLAATVGLTVVKGGQA